MIAADTRKLTVHRQKKQNRVSIIGNQKKHAQYGANSHGREYLVISK